MDVPVRIADLDKIDAILYDITELINSHKALSTEMHRIVRLRKIEQHAAMIWVSCYTTGINLKDFVDVREDVLLSIKNIMFRHGTTFASTLERTGNTSDPSLQEFKSIPITLDGQKATLSPELQRLKTLQETLWDQARDLNASERELSAQRSSLLEDKRRLEEYRENVNAEDMEVQSDLDQLAEIEADLQHQEENMESSMDDLQVREDAVDQVLRELRSKFDTSGLPEGSLANTQLRERNVAEADRVIEIHQEMLSQEKQELENERKLLEERKAAAHGEGEPVEGMDAGLDVDDDELSEAARTQKIAESLGGE